MPRPRRQRKTKSTTAATPSIARRAALSAAPSAPDVSQDVFLRKARRCDREEMKACNERNLTENYPLEQWESMLLESPGQSFVVANEQRRVVAYVAVRGNLVISLAVDPSQRQKGWGHKLITAAKEAAFAANQPNLQLHVRDSNVVAQHLYEMHGFERSVQLPKYYADKEDAWLMTCPNPNYKHVPSTRASVSHDEKQQQQQQQHPAAAASSGSATVSHI